MGKGIYGYGMKGKIKGYSIVDGSVVSRKASGINTRSGKRRLDKCIKTAHRMKVRRDIASMDNE